MVNLTRFFFVFLLSIVLYHSLAGQDEVVERVDVVNREVVVRVFDGGDPVPGLTRKNFALTENGKPVTITSCRQVRRSLAPAREIPDTQGPEAQPQQGRLFLFLLWWNEKNQDWPKAWNYFLENIYRPGDHVILSGDQVAIQLKDPLEETEKLAEFFHGIRGDLKKKQQNKSGLKRELESCTRNFDQDLKENERKTDSFKIPWEILFNQFKSRYLGILEEYRLQRLRIQPEMMRRLSTALREVETEKWALVFLQNERLPLVDMRSSLLTHTSMTLDHRFQVKRFIEECDRRIRMATDMAVHIRDLRSQFIGAGATFHLFLSDAKGETMDSDLLHWTPIFSSWESSFRSIARDTGGAVQDTTQLKKALEKAASRSDIYYVLTYKPKGTDRKKPRLSIKVSRPGLKVVYARRLRPREIRPLKLSEPRWESETLRFQLSDYLRETGEGGTISGDVHVKVSSENNSGEPLEFEKVLHPVEESATVEMKVNFPEPGDYTLTVAVTDRLSGNTARNYTRASIVPPEPEVQEPMDPKLKAVLDKAAVYCRKLQKAAFRFTCTEVVEEKVLKRNPVSKRVEPETNNWNYDYQVVAAQNKVTEQRVLLRNNQKKVNVSGAKLETRFKAQYPVFLPVTLLGKRNRKNYRYSLVETKRLKKRHCAIIEVTPLDPGKGPMARGRVWVDVDNGSVLKIEMDPRGVVGSVALETAAKKMSARLDLKALHWYLEEHKDLRFPSSVGFSESYVFDREVKERKTEDRWGRGVFGARGPGVKFGYRIVEFYRISQTYKKYRYFEVDTQVEIVDTK